MKTFVVWSYSTRIAVPAASVFAQLDAEEGRHVRDARGLLHVVRDDHDRVLVLELVDQVLDPRRRDRVEGRGRLVHQDHVRLDGERARDAEALLLTAREAERVLLQPVLDLVPERGVPERALDALVEALLHAEDARAERDVVVDRLGERVRLLEDHADAAANLDRVDVRAVEVAVVVEHLAFDAGAGDEVVHAVEAADERALAAARRPDERRHEVLLDVEADTLEGDVARVAHGQVAHGEHRLGPAAVGCGGKLAELAGIDARCRHSHEPASSVSPARSRVGFGVVNEW